MTLPTDKSAAPDGFKAELLARTSQIVRRRAAWRRLRRGGALATAYVLGLATAWFAASRGPAPANTNEEPTLAQVEDRNKVAANPAPTADQDVKSPAAPPKRSATPEELRRRVYDAPRDEQIRLLTLAGDKYLVERRDVEGALYCYRQVLELTPVDQRHKPNEKDTWLLASLKQEPPVKRNAK